MKRFLTIFGIILLSAEVYAASPKAIIDSNTPAIVYLEVTDDKGSFMDSGTGFIVSRDGYIVTVAHVKPAPGQKLWAVIGQREGTRYPLSFRDADESLDVALWQLPQAAVCRAAVTISSKSVNVLDRVLVLGFPEKDGLTPSGVGINNTSTPEHGFYKADGFLRPGNSGGPAFNEAGQVVAIVQGGTMPGTSNNDLIPISLAINLIKKRGVQAGIDTALPYENSCFSLCRHSSHGIERWGTQKDWGPVNSGWLDGGHNPADECNKLVAAALAGKPDAQIEFLPGERGQWQESKKDVFGHVEYRYSCKGIFRADPVYGEKQSPACPLRQ
ncbi:MAG: serine protease [Acetobacteraceae bacterium]